MATKVTLRRKLISKGRQSLYLDFYPPIPHPDTGELTRRKFLGMYLFIDKAEIKKEVSKYDYVNWGVTWRYHLIGNMGTVYIGFVTFDWTTGVITPGHTVCH